MQTDETFLFRRSAQMVREDPAKARGAFAAAAAQAAPCRNCGKNHRTITYEQCVDRKMSEKTLQDRVRGHAKRRGWKVIHAGKGWIGGKPEEGGQFVTQFAPGYPDLMFFKVGMPYPVFCAELKRQTEEPDEEQWTWIALLNACGIPTVVFRPSDLREGRVQAILEGR